MAVRVTSLQSVRLFGIFRQPIMVLSWHDVKQHNFTWRNLRALGLEAQELKQLQPDKNEWLQRGGIQVADLIDMIVFPVNPHFVHAALPGADLKVPSAQGTHWPSTGPVKPLSHTQAEILTCLVLLWAEFAGHGVHWLELKLSA